MSNDGVGDTESRRCCRGPRASTPCARANFGPVAVRSKPKARPWRSSSARLAPVPQPQSSSRRSACPAAGRGQPRRDEAAKAAEPEVRTLGAVGEFEQAIEMVHADAPARLRVSGGHGTIRPACASAGLAEAAAVARRRPAPHRGAHLSAGRQARSRGPRQHRRWPLRALERGLGGRCADRASRARSSTPTSSTRPAARSRSRKRTSAPAPWPCRPGDSPAIRISPTTPSCSSPS